MLLDADGARVIGEAFDAAGMSVQVAKEGDSSFSAFPTFDINNWDEIGLGLYEVILRESDTTEKALLDTEGHLKLYVKTDNTRGDLYLFKVNSSDVARETAVNRNADLIESQRGEHTWQGNYFYVDPVNGDTHANLNRGGRSDPYSSVQDCHDNAVTDHNHDVIFLVAGNSGGLTTLTEQVTISKNRVFIRGPGQDFLWNYGANGDVITVTGAGVELSGFRIDTHTAGAGDAVKITGDFCVCRHLWIGYARSNGIEVDDADWCTIEYCVLEGCGTNAASAGIRISATVSATHTHVIRNKIYETIGDGIDLVGAAVDHSVIMGNIIEMSTVYGIVVSAGVVSTSIVNNDFHLNASGDISDGGTSTQDKNNRQWAKHSIATEARLAELDAGNLPTDVAAVQSQVDKIDNAATTVPGSATTGSLLDRLANKDGSKTFSQATDALEAIADSGGGGPTAPQIADAVWDEATADHVGVGSFGKWAADLTASVWTYATRTLTAWLGGAKECTITVLDGDSAPVGDCPFAVRNAGGTVLQDGTTDSSSGEIVVNLAEGSYAVTLGSLITYSFSNPYALDVGAAAAQAFTLTCALLAAPAAPDDPTMCALYAYMYFAETGQTLGAGEGTLGLTDIVARPDDDNNVYSTATAPAETDANGLVTVNAPRGAVVKLKATWPTNESKIITVTVPALDSLDVGTYLQD